MKPSVHLIPYVPGGNTKRLFRSMPQMSSVPMQWELHVCPHHSVNVHKAIGSLKLAFCRQFCLHVSVCIVPSAWLHVRAEMRSATGVKAPHRPILHDFVFTCHVLKWKSVVQLCASVIPQYFKASSKSVSEHNYAFKTITVCLRICTVSVIFKSNGAFLAACVNIQKSSNYLLNRSHRCALNRWTVRGVDEYNNYH